MNFMPSMTSSSLLSQALPLDAVKTLKAFIQEREVIVSIVLSALDY